MPTIDVSAALVFREGKLLITQRHAEAHLGGLWEFPGGKREPGETFEQCLRRELVEELGIEVEVGALLEEITHEYPERCVRLQFFLCILPAGEPQAFGCAALAWITREQLGEYSFPAADARLLGRLRRSSELWSA
ncbi:MAG: 8-oxo-dGTP diphosphatase MutT [Pedosphaera sp.]|nr:8-oxo-dGTP diphosphatase MutT [Pedosphaera sp.]